MRRRAGSIAAGIVALGGLAGCGGSDSAPAPQTRTVGPMTTRLVGAARPPVTATGLGSIAVGLAGATFTELTLNPGPPTLADTRIAYYPTDSASPGVYLISPSGTDAPYRAWSNQFGLSEPSWSRDGTVLVSDGNLRQIGLGLRSSGVIDGTSNTIFVDATSVSNNPSNVTVALGDGSVRNLTTTNKDTNPAWWPASRICFESWRDGNSEIYVMNADGTGQTRLTNNPAADTAPCWAPDGNTIGFVSSRNGRQEIFTMPADGSSNTLLISESTGNCWDPQFSPDGTRVCYVTNKDGNSEIYVADVTGLNRTRITNNTTSDFDPSWSPDGSQIVYTHLNATGGSEIWVSTTSGATLKQGMIAARGARPYWSPFVASRPLIGPANTPYGASAAGFLYGQKGDVTTSVLVFNTVNPSGATIDTLTPPGVNAPNFVFEVKAADAIKSLSFQNDFYQRPVSPVPSAPELTPTVTGALVTMNATTGKIASVLTYTANRSIAPPVVSGRRLTLHRSFVGIWDASGRNRAPHGATEATLEIGTGALVGFH